MIFVTFPCISVCCSSFKHFTKQTLSFFPQASKAPAKKPAVPEDDDDDDDDDIDLFGSDDEVRSLRCG